MARTVLIVDDSAPFRATARALLQARGYEVVGAAEDAASALRDALALRPDAVLLDVNLPDGDGLELAPRLRADGWAPAIVLVSTDDAPSLDGAPVRGFLAKSDLAAPRLIELLGPPATDG